MQLVAEHGARRIGVETKHERRASWALRLVLGVALAAVVACSKARQPVAENTSSEAPRSNALSWYEDDPEGAMRAARERGLSVFVELWAPWCHTCLSMKRFVITRENVPVLEKSFVLLAVNTEKEENAAFLERFPVAVWPTFYVVAPRENRHESAAPSDHGRSPWDGADRGDIVGRWLGAASPSQLQRFLSESKRAAALRNQGALAADDPLRQLAAGDLHATNGEHTAAAEAYGKALALAPPGWPRRPETLVAQITALWKAKAINECLALGNAGIEQTGSSASAVDFAHYALECASQRPSPLADSTLRRAEHRLDVLCREGSSELSPDDRADACSALGSTRTTLGNKDGAHHAALQRLAVLEQAINGKPPDVAMTYDWARTDVLIELGRAEEALSFLSEHERFAPDNYNPPQQQARCYKALGRWNEGLAAIDRALALAYGPRHAGFLTLRADLLAAAGRNADAHETLERQLAAYRALPAGQRQPAAEERVAQRLRDWKDSAVH